jgi:hypothetical protein
VDHTVSLYIGEMFTGWLVEQLLPVWLLFYVVYAVHVK